MLGLGGGFQRLCTRYQLPMSALPPKADVGTGTRITFDAATPAAWRFSLAA